MSAEALYALLLAGLATLVVVGLTLIVDHYAASDEPEWQWDVAARRRAGRR